MSWGLLPLAFSARRTSPMTAEEFAEQFKRLASQTAELNRIDAAVVAAAKGGAALPPSNEIFGALSDASIACAEVIDTYGARSVPANVRTGLFRLNCATTDLAASLKLYVTLMVRPTGI
jgi:hypothetical protein